MLEARFVPLPRWNRTPGLQRERARFRTNYTRTLDALEYEIGKLSGRDVRIEAGYSSNQIRNDGWPRGSAAPSHPGVVLYLESAEGALCFPCGTYDSMQANLYAIALTLEKLRAIDRYGVTLQHEQYRGFAALPPPAALAMTPEQAAIFISAIVRGVPGGMYDPRNILSDRVCYRDAYRRAAKESHPDVAPGSNEKFLKLSQAKEALDRHHSLTPQE